MHHGIERAGPWLHVYHSAGRPDEGETVQAGVLLGDHTTAGLPATGEPAVRELPGVPLMACVVHDGGADTRHAAYQALGRWLEATDYRIVGACRELYLRQPGNAVPITEIQFPVAQSKGGMH